MKKVVLCIFGVFCIFFFIFIAYRGNIKVEKVLYDELIDTVEKNEFSVVYFGNESESLKKTFYKLKKDFNIKTYYCNDVSYDDFILSSGLSKDEVKFPGYMIYKNGYKKIFINGQDSKKELSKYLNYYINNIIPKEETFYKTPNSSSDYLEELKSDKTVISVFGKNSCKYCNMYLPVINDIAKNNKLDTYYFDQENYDKKELDKIYNINIIIPKECSGNNEDGKLSEGFSKPLTIITKSGKLVGCIKGYYDYEYVLNKLKDYKVVEE